MDMKTKLEPVTKASDELKDKLNEAIACFQGRHVASIAQKLST